MSTTAMRRSPLGLHSGIEVTKIGLGLWAVPDWEWGPGDADDTLRAIAASREAGVNFYDTADIYGDGLSEELLGKAIRGCRDDFVVATKIGWAGFDPDAGKSAYSTVDLLVEGVEGSLRRLGTDHLDLIQCHISYPEPNTEVFIDGFRLLKDQGKTRAWGISTGDLGHLRRFNAGGDCDTLQIDYSLLNRIPEAEVFPYCLAQGIGVIVRGPLAMGLLSGKYRAGHQFPQGDFRRSWNTDPEQNTQFLADLETVERLGELVPEGQTLSQFALRFAASHPAVTTVIPGARNPAQAAQNVAAGLMPRLSEKEIAAVDRIVPPGGGRKIWPEVT